MTGGSIGLVSNPTSTVSEPPSTSSGGDLALDTVLAGVAIPSFWPSVHVGCLDRLFRRRNHHPKPRRTTTTTTPPTTPPAIAPVRGDELEDLSEEDVDEGT